LVYKCFRKRYQVILFPVKMWNLLKVCIFW
jgi:hypothetical protein